MDDDPGTEAEAMADMDDGAVGEYEISPSIGYLWGRHKRQNVSTNLDALVGTMKARYEVASKVRVGQQFKCAFCNKEGKKGQYQQKFCSTLCKDRYWNHVDPNRRQRAKHYNR